MPGKPALRIPTDRRVETKVDPWVFLSHQHLLTHIYRSTSGPPSNYLCPLSKWDNRFVVFVSVPTMTIRVIFVGPRASRVSGPSVGRL